MKTFKDHLDSRLWHMAKITGRLFNYKQLFAKAKTEEEKLLIALKTEVYAQKKHIVLTEMIIEKYERAIKLNIK